MCTCMKGAESTCFTVPNPVNELLSLGVVPWTTGLSLEYSISHDETLAILATINFN